MKRKSVFLVVLAAVMLFAFAVVGNAGMTGVVHSFDALTKPNLQYTTLTSGTKSDLSTRAAVQVKESLLYDPNGSCTFMCKIQKYNGSTWTDVSDLYTCTPAGSGQILKTTLVYYEINGVPQIVNLGDTLRARGRSTSVLDSGDPMRGFINFN